ncbi:hypothetical protein CIL03_08570 [Virgibacillus indicus]|uniref:Uncharacterized protein n=2 Tax=Virgibacillus indicus TaxID=2024554 RepID=A0A265NC66_9BACI|nr:hypothetical protein CIL03_08570 [Virgibacillus indicus]
MISDFIVDYKWYFFIVGEIIFWGSIIGSLLFRYIFNMKKLSRYLILLWLLSDLWLLTLGIFVYVKTGEFDTFQIIIIIAIIYVFTEGKKDLEKLDRFINRMTVKWKK